MGSAQNNSGGGWLLDYGICDEVSASDFIWTSPIIDDPMVSRRCVESLAAPGTKACREKFRRDKLNDRFTELCSILDPGRPPKADKVAILSDAARRLNQLRLEAERLRESNETLQGTIKSLKEEKSELRDEKARLKVERDRMQQLLKATSATPAFIPHPAAVSAGFHSGYKAVTYPRYPPTGMWQWLPPAVLDTSQDHVLRPPVA